MSLPPLVTHHTPLISIPSPVLDQSLACASHYSGAQVVSHSNVDIKLVHQRILDDLHELYCCRPSYEILDRSWSHDAVFELPLRRCRGYKEYAALWFALSKMMSRSETLALRIMSSTDVPNRLIFHQIQKYTSHLFKFTKVGLCKLFVAFVTIRVKVIDSIVVVELDKDEKIIRLVDQWNGADLPRRFGARWFRTANAKAVSWFMQIQRNAG
ncbi:hypothetical protein JOM56_003755 [Amanita muscaria]